MKNSEELYFSPVPVSLPGIIGQENPFEAATARGNFNWYGNEDRQQLAERIHTVCRFSDWLCAINPEMDNTLPSCWTAHPYPILLMDSLYSQYAMSYTDENGVPAYFIDGIDRTVERLRSWQTASNHIPGKPCPGRNETLTARQKARHIAEFENSGLAPVRNWIFPENAADRAFQAAHAASLPRLEDMTEQTC